MLKLYNRYRTRIHGEEVVFNQTVRLLQAHGVDVDALVRDSAQIGSGLLGRVSAALESIYSASAASAVRERIRLHRPDVVHAHNLYPLLTPSAILAAAREQVPVVLTLHHYFLTCPVLTHYSKGRICTRCAEGASRHAVLGNCRDNLLESTAYAMRSAIARHRRWFDQAVDAFVALTRFAKAMLVQAGYAADRIHVIPNAVPCPIIEPQPELGDYVAFAGRLTAEKGVDDLIEAARRSGLPTRVAGDAGQRQDLSRSLPANVELVGVLRGRELAEFYRRARIVVVPSRSFEMCPMSLLEAMSYARPVMVTRVSGLAEIVADGAAGTLIAPHDPATLADALSNLWGCGAECARLGAAARARIESHHNETLYANRLMKLYEALGKARVPKVSGRRRRAS